MRVRVRLSAPEGFRPQVAALVRTLAERDIDVTLVPPGTEAEIALVPADEASGLEVPERVMVLALLEPRDGLVVWEGGAAALDELPAGSVVGLSGLLRREMLGVHRPDLEAWELEPFQRAHDLMEREEIDAWIAPVRELRSAGMADDIGEVFEPTSWASAAGRGTALLDASGAPDAVVDPLKAMDDAQARAALEAELTVLRTLGVDRDAAVGVMATPHGELLRVRALVPAAKGRRLVRAEVSGTLADPADAGRRTAALLVERGAEALLGSRSTR
jgi:hydroxymethylbilane synthase